MKIGAGKSTERSERFRQAWFWIAFFVACLFIYLVEHWAEDLIQSGEHPGFARSVFGISAFYQSIVTAGPRKPKPRFTAVVEINSGKDPAVPDLYSLCEQRRFLGKLISSIANAAPSVIVIDKYFTPRLCPQIYQLDGNSLSGTDLLLRAINGISKTIPIVVGRRVKPESRDLYPAIAFLSDQDHVLYEGIINIDRDSRKLPLKWKVQDDKVGQYKESKRVWHKTLALSVAEAFDQRLLNKHTRLRKLLDEGVHPFISFLQGPQFEVFPAGQVLKGPVSITRGLRGKIVIVGEVHPDADRHESVVGNVPGVILQANYIEALLDERYFEPIPWLDYALGFLIFASFQWVLVRHYQPLWQAVAWGLGIIAIAIVLLYLLATLGGWYVNPVAVGFMALVIWYTHLLLPKKELPTKGESL